MPNRKLKLTSLSAIYAAFLILALTLSLHGSSLVSQYYSGYTINTHSLITDDGYSFSFNVVMKDEFVSNTGGDIPLIMVGHGLGNSKEDALRRGIHFARNDYIIVLPDFRGHGSHQGPIRLDKEWQDVVQIFNFIGNSSRYSMVNVSNIGTWGHSNGAFQSMMVAIHEPRVRSCVASSGAYNTSELLAHEDSRLYIIGTSFDPNNPDEIKKRSPIDLVNTTNPENLLLFAGDSDDNVPYIHSQQLNATVNPTGARADYEYIIYEGEGHGIGNKEEVIQKSVSWFDQYLKNSTTNASTVSLFQASFSKSEIEDTFIGVFWLIMAGFIPLLYLLEEFAVLGWNSLISRRKKKISKNEMLSIGYFKEIRTSIELESQNLYNPSYKMKAVFFTVSVSGWLIINFAIGSILSPLLISRVLTFFSMPFLAFFAFMFIFDLAFKKKEIKEFPTFSRGMKTGTFTSGDFIKDLLLSLISVVPAWLIQVQLYNLLAANSHAIISLVGNFWVAVPSNPISFGILTMFGIFWLVIFILGGPLKILYTMITRGWFHNTSGVFWKKKWSGTKRFLLWFLNMIGYSLLVGIWVLAGAFFFLLLMPNPLATEIDFVAQINVLLLLAFALITIIAMIIQQILEKLLRSFNKSVLISALVLLGFFLSVAPRPI